MDPGLIIVAAIVGSAVAVMASYAVVRYAKGRIRIVLPKTAVAAGEVLKGTLQLLAKKPIDGTELKVTLECMEVITTRSGGKTRTQRQEVYRDEVQLEGPRQFAPGFAQDYPFQFQVPRAVPPEESPLTAGMRFAFGANHRLEWRVRGRLEARGVDLSGSQQVYVRAA